MNYAHPVEQSTERKIIACTRCEGEGVVYLYPPNDYYRREDPTEEVCPLCLGTGLVHRTITTITKLTPFYPQKKQLSSCRNNCQTAAQCECRSKISKVLANEQTTPPPKYD